MILSFWLEVVGGILPHHPLSAFLRRKICKPKEEIGNLNGFEYMYLCDLKVPYMFNTHPLYP
jgi:hypothetical protein